jgi:hypothetical protein
VSDFAIVMFSGLATLNADGLRVIVGVAADLIGIAADAAWGSFHRCLGLAFTH